MGRSLECDVVAVALQILASGFAAGAVYGLVAAGQSVVFRLTGVVNFAFGELIALGVFVTLLVAAGSGPVSQTSVGGGRFLLALVVGLVVTAAASAGSYFLAIEPYRARGSVIGWVGASLAVAFAVRTLLLVFFDRPAYVFPDPLPFGVWRVDGVTIQQRSLVVAGGRRRAGGARRGGAAADALRPRPRGDRPGLRCRRPRRVAGGPPRRAGVRPGRSLGRPRGDSRRALRARSTWTRPRGSVSTGSSQRSSSGSSRAGRSSPAWSSASSRRRSRRLHWSGAAAYRDVLPLAIGLVLLAWRARSAPEAVE